MTYNPDDELTITYRTLGKASGDAFELGYEEGRIDEIEALSDLISARLCAHAWCKPCQELEDLKEELLKRLPGGDD